MQSETLEVGNHSSATLEPGRSIFQIACWTSNGNLEKYLNITSQEGGMGSRWCCPEGSYDCTSALTELGVTRFYVLSECDNPARRHAFLPCLANMWYGDLLSGGVAVSRPECFVPVPFDLSTPFCNSKNNKYEISLQHPCLVLQMSRSAFLRLTLESPSWEASRARRQVDIASGWTIAEGSDYPLVCVWKSVLNGRIYSRWRWMTGECEN